MPRIKKQDAVHSNEAETPVKKKRGRPSKKAQLAKSKATANDEKKGTRTITKEKTIQLTLPPELLALLKSDALKHFLAAKNSFLLGVKSMLEGPVDAPKDKRKKAPAKNPKRTKKIKVE